MNFAKYPGYLANIPRTPRIKSYVGALNEDAHNWVQGQGLKPNPKLNSHDAVHALADQNINTTFSPENDALNRLKEARVSGIEKRPLLQRQLDNPAMAREYYKGRNQRKKLPGYVKNAMELQKNNVSFAKYDKYLANIPHKPANMRYLKALEEDGKAWPQLVGLDSNKMLEAHDATHMLGDQNIDTARKLVAHKLNKLKEARIAGLEKTPTNIAKQAYDNGTDNQLREYYKGRRQRKKLPKNLKNAMELHHNGVESYSFIGDVAEFNCQESVLHSY